MCVFLGGGGCVGGGGLGGTCMSVLASILVVSVSVSVSVSV
jgi:hypothetical protein